MLSNFSYIKIPYFTGEILQDIQVLLYANNKKKTYEHSKAVANTNIEIAKQYKLDINICELCGYLHDISAMISPNDMLIFAQNNRMYIDEAEKKYPFLLHQRMSKLIAEQDFHITDNRILSAIECHSTLRMNPTSYDMALFIADKLSWDKEGLPPFYELMCNNLKGSLELASLAYMDYIIVNKMILYPHKWFEDGMRFLKTLI